MNGSNRIITLGTLHHFISEISDALEGARQLVEKSCEASTADDYPHNLLINLAIQYAQDLKNEIFPFRDKDGRDYWADEKNTKKHCCPAKR